MQVKYAQSVSFWILTWCSISEFMTDIGNLSKYFFKESSNSKSNSWLCRLGSELRDHFQALVIFKIACNLFIIEGIKKPKAHYTGTFFCTIHRHSQIFKLSMNIKGIKLCVLLCFSRKKILMRLLLNVYDVYYYYTQYKSNVP